MNKEFFDYIRECYPESVVLDGLEDGAIGIDSDGHVVYSYGKCCKALMEHDGMTEGDAREWIDCNTIRALPYMGENRPVMMHDMEDFI